MFSEWTGISGNNRHYNSKLTLTVHFPYAGHSLGTQHVFTVFIYLILTATLSGTFVNSLSQMKKSIHGEVK